MPTQTNEQALEAAIQETLSGTTIEKIKEQDPQANIAEEPEQYLFGNGYYIGDPDDFENSVRMNWTCIGYMPRMKHFIRHFSIR